MESFGEKKLCRHCHKEPVSRPRGLGWRCYYTPAVRALYPSGSKYARRSDLAPDAPPPLPPTDATDLLPGPDRVLVYAGRFERGGGKLYFRRTT
jgi:hypothetical protein